MRLFAILGKLQRDSSLAIKSQSILSNAASQHAIDIYLLTIKQEMSEAVLRAPIDGNYTVHLHNSLVFPLSD